MLSFPTLCVHAVIKNFFFLASRLQLNPYCHFWWAVRRIFTVRWHQVRAHLETLKPDSYVSWCTGTCLSGEQLQMNECTGNGSGYSERLSNRLLKNTELYGYNSKFVWVILLLYISSKNKMLIYICRHSTGSCLVYFLLCNSNKRSHSEPLHITKQHTFYFTFLLPNVNSLFWEKKSV